MFRSSYLNLRFLPYYVPWLSIIYYVKKKKPFANQLQNLENCSDFLICVLFQETTSRYSQFFYQFFRDIFWENFLRERTTTFFFWIFPRLPDMLDHSIFETAFFEFLDCYCDLCAFESWYDHLVHGFSKKFLHECYVEHNILHIMYFVLIFLVIIWGARLLHVLDDPLCV